MPGVFTPVHGDPWAPGLTLAFGGHSLAHLGGRRALARGGCQDGLMEHGSPPLHWGKSGISLLVVRDDYKGCGESILISLGRF